MRRIFAFLLLVVVLGLWGVACTPVTTNNIDVRNPAVARNQIFSVEPRNNGTYTIWLMNDDVAAYCATTKIVGETALKALRSKSGEAIITYRNLLPTDKNYNRKPFNYDYNPDACIAEGAEIVYYILSIEVLDELQG